MCNSSFLCMIPSWFIACDVRALGVNGPCAAKGTNSVTCCFLSLQKQGSIMNGDGENSSLCPTARVPEAMKMP